MYLVFGLREISERNGGGSLRELRDSSGNIAQAAIVGARQGNDRSHGKRSRVEFRMRNFNNWKHRESVRRRYWTIRRCDVFLLVGIDKAICHHDESVYPR